MRVTITQKLVTKSSGHLNDWTLHFIDYTPRRAPQNIGTLCLAPLTKLLWDQPLMVSLKREIWIKNWWYKCKYFYNLNFLWHESKRERKHISEDQLTIKTLSNWKNKNKKIFTEKTCFTLGSIFLEQDFVFKNTILKQKNIQGFLLKKC